MRAVLSASALIAFSLAVQAASANPITYTLTNGPGFVSNDLTMSVNYHPSGGGGFSVYAYVGPLSLNVTNNSTSLTTPMSVFCTDIFDDYSPGGVYTLGHLGDTLTDTVKLGQINALLGHVVPGVTPGYGSAAEAGAAMQAAIWEIENEPGTSGYDINSGVFSVSSGGASDSVFQSDASIFLSNIEPGGSWAASPSDVVSQFEVVAGGGANQRFSFLDSPSVPEPTSMALLGVGLLGLGGLRRRTVKP